jgi:DNA-binding LacI/PurR family transcriptional regulator
MTTQRDIADQLGVSVMTVSLALRGDAQISEATRAQVLELAEEMGYVYHPRKSAAAQTTQVAFIGRYSAASAFYLAVLHGAERACQEHDLALHYIQLEEAVQRFVLQDTADALMMVSSIDAETIERFKRFGLPMVLVDNNLPHLSLDRVLIENLNSLYRTVLKLVEWGHRRILFVCGPDEIPSFRDRARGYRAAMSDLGLEPAEVPCDYNSTVAGAREQIAQWLDQVGCPACTALVACNDKTAIGAMQALQSTGLRVPEDISVVGFDDIDMACVVRPALTTVHVHRELLGEMGVRMLVERMDHPSRPAMALALETDFVERESTRPLQ